MGSRELLPQSCEVDIETYTDEVYELIKDHPDECSCDDCWEFYILTQK